MISEPVLSIVIPARDEAGTIARIPDKLPTFGVPIELIFVEGFSHDDTWRRICQLKKERSSKDLSIIACHQGVRPGKAEATWTGIRRARGEIVMILDADLSVPPESLLLFYKQINKSNTGFVNGSRFVHAHERGAMRYINHLGNRFFARVFSFLLGHKITDTLCGTKVFFRSDFEHIQKVTQNFIHLDPYGDFTLLLGAALLHLRIREVPVRYKARVYGKSKISPFFDGIKLLILLVFALRSFFSKVSAVNGPSKKNVQNLPSHAKKRGKG